MWYVCPALGPDPVYTLHHNKATTLTPAQRYLWIYQLPGGEGQEVHSQHTYQWYVFHSLPKTPAIDITPAG